MGAWLRSPILWACIAVVAGFFYGQHIGKTRCEGRMAEAIAEMQARQADEIARVLEDANERIAEAETEMDAIRDKVADYAKDIAARPDVCRLSDDDARLLRDIR